MLTRRKLLGSGVALVVGTALPALAQVPAAEMGPPPPSPDAYGLRKLVGTSFDFDQVLRDFGEPAILADGAKVLGATFRITENYSLRRPRTARIVFLPVDEASALAVIREYGNSPQSPQKPLTVLRYFDGQEGIRLRALVDDEERFWNASPNPPNWGAISCQARNGGRACPPSVDGGASLLEARVGPNVQAILRKNPSPSDLVQQVAKAVFS